jgi:hypothetical protein
MKRQDRQKSKANKQESHSDPHQDCAQKQEYKWNGDARVSGEIGIKIPPDLLAQYQADQKANTAHNNKSRLINGLTLIAVVIYAGLTAWQGCETRQLVKTAQDTYEAAGRPYIGFGDVRVDLIYPKEKAGAAKLERIPKNAIGMAYNVQVKNFGTVSGILTRDDIDVRINGAKVRTKGVPAKPSELFPGESISVNGTISAETFQDILRGDVILEANIWISYSHANHNYDNCERIQFAPDQLVFFNQGAICGTPWTIPKK